MINVKKTKRRSEYIVSVAMHVRDLNLLMRLAARHGISATTELRNLIRNRAYIDEPELANMTDRELLDYLDAEREEW